MEPEEFQKSLEEELIFINGLENSQDQKLIGHRENLNIGSKQLKYDPNTGEVQEWYVNPYNNVDALICYKCGVNKHQCDE